MHTIKAQFISDHRLARFITWGRAVLAWLALMLCADAAPRRRHFKRYGLLERTPRFIACLIVIRAAKLARLPAPARATRPNNTPPGFARASFSPYALLRAAIGARLRRRLRPTDLAALLTAMRDLDVLARRLARRFRRRLTRLNALIAVRPPHQAARSIAAPLAPCAADTS